MSSRPSASAAPAFLTAAFFLMAASPYFAKGFDAEEALMEGKMLCALEKASLVAEGLVRSEFPDKRDEIGGYVSYSGGENIYAAFYDKDEPDAILFRFKFDSVPNRMPVSEEIGGSVSTPIEKKLISLRKAAVHEVVSNTWNFFRACDRSTFRFIPVIGKREDRVYILTSPVEDGYAFLGNDYMLVFDKKGGFVGRERLHEGVWKIPFKAKNPDNYMGTIVHGHDNSDLLLPTDICTILLYKEFAEWRKFQVVGTRHCYILQLATETLTVRKVEKARRAEAEKDDPAYHLFMMTPRPSPNWRDGSR